MAEHILSCIAQYFKLKPFIVDARTSLIVQQIARVIPLRPYESAANAQTGTKHADRHCKIARQQIFMRTDRHKMAAGRRKRSKTSEKNATLLSYDRNKNGGHMGQHECFASSDVLKVV